MLSTDELRDDLAAACADFVNVCEVLAGAAADVARLDAQLRAAENRLGIDRPFAQDIRQCCADVLFASAAALRPSVPFVSEVSAAAVVDVLTEVRDERCDERYADIDADFGEDEGTPSEHALWSLS